MDISRAGERTWFLIVLILEASLISIANFTEKTSGISHVIWKEKRTEDQACMRRSAKENHLSVDRILLLYTCRGGLI